MCWFEENLGEVEGAGFEKVIGLGLLERSFCSHYDSEPDRKDTYRSNIQKQHLKPGMDADDGVTFNYIDDTFYQSVSSRPKTKGYGVSCAIEPTEESIKVAYLGEDAGNARKENISN